MIWCSSSDLKMMQKEYLRETKMDRHTTKKLMEKAFPKVPNSENAFIKVQGNKSPFDGDLVYWSKRNSRPLAKVFCDIIFGLNF
jgi:5-methylcytosine-specific restriction endonuclease McrA